LSALVGAAVALTTVLVATPAQADATSTSVAGRVTLNGTPTGGLTVCASAAVYGDQGYQNYGDCTTTAPDGTYSVSFDFPGSSNMATVWVDPGEQYRDVFSQTSYGEYRPGVAGYIDLAQGNHLAGIDIALTKIDKSSQPVIVGAPTISGSPRIGKKLQAAVQVTGADAPTVSYRWYRNGKKIAGATKATYRLAKRDSRKKITVAVTVRVPGQNPVVAVSAPTSKIAR
jgi:hypothetical protein